MKHFKIKKELSQNNTFKLHESPLRKHDHYEFRIKQEGQDQVLKVADEQHEPTRVSLEVFASICLPFVLGFILSV